MNNYFRYVQHFITLFWQLPTMIRGIYNDIFQALLMFLCRLHIFESKIIIIQGPRFLLSFNKNNNVRYVKKKNST